VDDAPTATGGSQIFRLRADLPIRVLVVAAVSAAVGAVLVVIWGAAAVPFGLAVVGLVLLAFGLALVVAAALAQRRLRQTVTLSEAGIRLESRRVTRSLPWSAVVEVSLRGPLLGLRTAEGREAGEPVEVINPGGGSDRAFEALLDAIRTRLDADRGYRPFS
jgi:membrane protein implicated in regulation of membrane protease activity